MNILLVEDDPEKAELVGSVVEESIPDARIEEARSYKAAIQSLRARPPDIVVLDMSIPTSEIGPVGDGGDPLPFGGRSLLSRMRRWGMQSPVVVVTAFDTFRDGSEILTLPELSRRLSEEFPGNFVAAVYFQPASRVWKQQLSDILHMLAQ